MVDKILFTSSFNSLLQKSKTGNKQMGRRVPLILPVCLLFLNIHCAPKIDWIRALPTDLPRDTKISLGVYVRPTEKKSPYNSKQFHLYWKEEIHLQQNSQFVKTWSEWKVYEDHSEFHQKEGMGTFEKSGEWVLFKTNSISEVECKSTKKDKTIPQRKDWFSLFPCAPQTPKSNRRIEHRLLYFFDGKSLYPLQFESGYHEADFGIAWESDLPYTRSSLFEKARLKYGKKEFQPHVYNHVKLD
ncbi:hypothetical protein CH372_09995 [Leptospira meyeri]|uniref:hypothetical protein n=1 Tax=Leptospira meyeri TaxID=29508 RepID=UPI000C2B3D74|nr:hypothetical protein [Leptospira meyeri]MCW7489396.1 hypothetical protein [Leptospira meyeri]PKA12305.1 hypothetical protein CH372_09995 [Leptospira meyeri]PKA24077.1 hypothetical protein CH381_22510 [Leptospira sp. mixed culture ATI2-C-A1]